MFKRLIAIMLTITLFTGMMPTNVLAEANPVLPDAEPAPVPMDTFMLSAAELTRIENLCGYATSVYHKGMSFSPSMTAWQMYCWLEDFQGQELAELSNQSQLLMAELGEHEDMNAAEISGLKMRVDDMSRDFLRYVSELEDLVLTIDSACANIRNSDLSRDEKSNSARRLQSCSKRLQPLMREIAGKVSDYQANYAEMSGKFTALHLNHAEKDMPTAQEAAPLLADASPFANLRAAGFYIQVLKANEAGFNIYDDQGKLLPNARVTVSHGSKKVDGKSNAHGVFVFDTGIFGVDEDNCFMVDIKIEADGLRTWESHNHEMHPGDHPRIDLEKDDGHAYIQAADLQHMDVLHEQNILYITPMNDGVQPFDVYVHQKPGDAGEAVVRYIDRNGKAREKRIPFAAGNNTIAKLDFKGTWCRDVHEDTQIELMITCGDRNGDELAAGKDHIVTKKAAVDAPVTNIPSPNYVPGMKFNFSIPINKPGLKSIDISFTPPFDLFGKLPLNVALDLDGTVMVGLSVVGLKKYTDGKADPTAWKYDNARDVRKNIAKASNLLKDSVSPSKSQEARTNAKKQLFDMGHVGAAKLNWGLMGMLQAKIDKKAGTGKFLGYIQISGDLNYSVTGNWGYPVFIGMDFNVGLSAGLQLGGKFKVNMEKANAIGKYGYMVPSTWHDLEWVKEFATIYFGFRFTIGVYAGIGIKSVLAAYIRGYFGFTLGVYITPWAGSLEKVFIFKGTMNAGIQLVVEALFGVVSSKFDVLKWSDTFPKYTALSASPDDPVKIEGVRVDGVRLSDRFNLKEGMKIVHVSGRGSNTTYLAFYTEPNGDGLQRLKCLISSPHGNPEEYPLDGIGEKAFDGNVPNDYYVYAFDVAEVAESGTDSKLDDDRGVVMLAVFFARRSEDIVSSNGSRRPGKTYGELCYYSKSPLFPIVPIVCRPGMKIDSFGGSALELQIEPYFDSKGEDLFEDNEFYIAVASWRRGNEPNVIYAAAERVRIRQRRSYIPLPGPKEISVTSVPITQQHSNFIQRHNSPIINYHVSYAHTPDADGYEHKLNFVALLDHGGPAPSHDLWIETMHCDMGSTKIKDNREQILFGSNQLYGFQHLTGQDYLMLLYRNEGGQYKLFRFSHKYDSGKGKEHFTSYGLSVWVSPTNYYAVDLGSSLAVYDMQTLSPSSKAEDTRYVLRATYVAESMDANVYIATKPFTLAVFEKEALDPAKGVTGFRMLRQPAGFLEGLAAENKTTDETQGTNLKAIRVWQTPVIKLDAAQPDPLVKVGDTVNVLITASNIGNIPVNSFMLRMTGKDENNNEKVLADYLIKCDNPARSALMQYNASGEQVLYVEGETAVSQYIDVGASQKNFWVTGNNDDDDKPAYWTKVLMPEDARDFRVPFTVTQDMAGHAYDVTLSVSAVTTAALQDDDGRYDSTAAWAPYLLSAEDDFPVTMFSNAAEPEKISFVYPNTSGMARNANNNVTIVPFEVNLHTDLSNLPVMGEEDMYKYSAYSDTAYPSTAQFELGSVDLELSANLYHVNDQAMVHLYVTNKTSVGVQNIRLEGTLDDEAIKPVNLNGDVAISAGEALSVDVPVSVLTGGATGRRLLLNVTTDAYERYLMDNEVEFLFLDDLAILREPQPITVPMDSAATFEVTAYGGTEPYTYQWQVSSTGVHGEFANVPGAISAQLTVAPVTNVENGNFYRCVVTDGTGKKVTSDPALLLVKADPLEIISQPQDCVTMKGGSAWFAVQIAGGSEPYSYQWEVLLNGEWTAINGATAATLQLDQVTYADNNKQYRCVVTDKVGRTITSAAAKLTISAVPVTGDHTPVELLIMLGAASVLLLVMLLRKRRSL